LEEEEVESELQNISSNTKKELVIAKELRVVVERLDPSILKCIRRPGTPSFSPPCKKIQSLFLAADILEWTGVQIEDVIEDDPRPGGRRSYSDI
jgi:hypothetical protein